MEESCRICLKTSRGFHHDLQDPVPELPHTSFYHMFTKVTGYDVTDLDPKCICGGCGAELVSAFSFITKCKLTEEALVSSRENRKFDINLNSVDSDLIPVFSESEAVRDGQGQEEVIVLQLVSEEKDEKALLNYDDLSSPGSSDEETTASELLHLRQSIGFECFIPGCRTIQGTLKALHEHVNASHPVMKCPLCQHYLEPEQYSTHLKVDHKSKGRKVSCEICNKVVDCKNYSPHLSKAHCISMEGKRAIRLKCKALNCHETIFTKLRWRFHTIYSHAYVKCSVCNFLLSGIRYVPKHFRDFHAEFGFDFVQFVPEPTDFGNDEAFRSAMTLVRQFNSREYKAGPQTCGICGKRFQGYKKLNAHIRFNHGGNEKAQICQHCGVNCRSWANLKIHLESHNTEQYKCDICSKFIKTKLNLKSHMNLVHLKNRSYACDKCDRVFTYWGSLYYHKRKKHGLVKAENESFMPLGLPSAARSKRPRIKNCL